MIAIVPQRAARLTRARRALHAASSRLAVGWLDDIFGSRRWRQARRQPGDRVRSILEHDGDRKRGPRSSRRSRSIAIRPSSAPAPAPLVVAPSPVSLRPD
jgi:hypothetical protein